MDAVQDNSLADAVGGRDAIVPDLADKPDSISNTILPTFVPEFGAGINGQAVELKSDQQGYFTIQRPETYDFTQGLTVSAWIKVDSAGALMNIVTCADDKPDPEGGFTLGYSYGTVFFLAVDASGRPVKVSSSDNMVQAGNWTHVAGVADEQSLRIYINGIEAASVRFDGPVKLSPTPLVIGNHATIAGWRHSTCPAFGGSLDELKIWEVPLDATAVQAESEAGL